jgi:GrpB-like predicted nucleotidyltransferase (UPF0157 family)
MTEMNSIIGQHKRNLSVVPYRSVWVALFEREADLLRAALGENALCIEHCGSTSIPGMAAKPIIDIMVAVVSLTQAVELIPAVESLGYEYRPIDTVPERMFFRKERMPEYRTHHLNLVQQDSGFWINQLAFRDYLRTHDQMAAAYVDLKVRLSEIATRTGEIDREGKTEFVARVLELVEEGDRG